MPYLSALEVCSQQGAIQIHVYITRYLTLPYNPHKKVQSMKEMQTAQKVQTMKVGSVGLSKV